MWCRIALKYPVAYSSKVCATYYQNTVNSAVKKKKPIKYHPFVKTAREALNAGEISHEIIKDLEEYANLLEIDTAIHDIEIGDDSLALKILMRNDTKISHRIKLLHILSTCSKNNLKIPLKTASRKSKVAIDDVSISNSLERQCG